MSSFEDQRIVGHAVDRGAEHVARVSKRAFDGAEHLRHAAHGVGILHAIAVLVVAMDLAVGEQHAEAARDFELMRRAARLVNARVERRVAAGEPVDRQCADHDRRVEQSLGAEQSVERQRQAQLRAVDQRESFLGLERERRKTRGRADVVPSRRRPPCSRFAFTDQAQRQMRERREVARGADRAAARESTAARRC